MLPLRRDVGKFCSVWNDPKVLVDFISLGGDFQTDDPLEGRQFCSCLNFDLVHFLTSLKIKIK